jgi:hypothetical protein
MVNFMVWWNNNFPHDLAYRKKYSIGFGSPAHRELNPIFMICEYEEELLLLNKRVYDLEYKHKANLIENGQIVDFDAANSLDDAAKSISNDDLLKIMINGNS